MDNAPFRQLKHGGWTIEGYSRAAVQSYWRVNELKIGFDLGAQPWDFMNTPTFFVSHTHLDHIAALAVYVARRRMMKMDPPVIYLPSASLDACQQMLKVFSKLDRGRLPCELIGVEPGQEIELTRELVVTPVETKHTIASLGFIVWERRKKLKPEYLSLQGHEIRDLRNQGVEISREVRLPLIGYTGDTAPAGLDMNPNFYDVQVLITEMTFVAPSHRKEKIHKHGHMHLDDFVARQQLFKNEVIIASHFSTRYSDKQVQRWIDKALPDKLQGRLQVWL
jgi:ribonuclease Z